MTHAQLVECARQWLTKIKCSVVVTEINCGANEQPDAIGWRGWQSIVVECKASREDFRVDADKHFRRELEKGMGCLRYFMAEEGVIPLPDVEAFWGLVCVSGGRFKVLKEASCQDRNTEAETGVLLSVVRRIGQQPISGVSIKCYVIPTKNRTTLTINDEEIHEPTPR